MPWTTLTEPSLGLGLLRSILDKADIPSRVMHLNIELLQWLKPTTYVAIANMYALNDFLFSAVLDRSPMTTRQHRILRDKAEILIASGAISGPTIDDLIAELVRLRATTIPAWLDTASDSIARTDATLVGFTCMFDQTVASLALAKLISQKAPDKVIALGGYAVRPPTAEAILDAFPWIDAIASSEGDNVIVPLANASRDRRRLSTVPGLITRSATTELVATPPAPPVEMETVPVPNFDDFLVDIAALDEGHDVRIDLNLLPVENSRGCWWGAVHHCIFCGINDDDMAYRHRSADAVLATLADLSSRYGVTRFRFADYILPHQYYTTLLPSLAELGAPYDLTCELKANISVDRFCMLAGAGFTAVQPGIESFSTPVLKRMNKGVSAAQNILTLKLGAALGVQVDYNIIYGFPGDQPEDYEAMVEQLPNLRHLDPPATRLEVQITRFAPLQVDPDRFGISASDHDQSYDLIFSSTFLRETGLNLDAYCYYFKRPFENQTRLARLIRKLEAAVDEWKLAHEDGRPALIYQQTANGMEIIDTRNDPERRLTLGPATASLMIDCAVPHLTSDVLARHPGYGAAALDQLRREGLVFFDGDHVVGLPIPGDGSRFWDAAPQSDPEARPPSGGSHNRRRDNNRGPLPVIVHR
jgi:ribosomal peptide maturation radical SAM protein 1